jgi:hypothetical protein
MPVLLFLKIPNIFVETDSKLLAFSSHAPGKSRNGKKSCLPIGMLVLGLHRLLAKGMKINPDSSCFSFSPTTYGLSFRRKPVGLWQEILFQDGMCSGYRLNSGSV